MEGIEKVHSLIEELQTAVSECFENATNFSCTAFNDGYMSITVMKWKDDPELPTEKQLRRVLWDQSRIFGEWTDDRSEYQNSYLRKCGCFMEGLK